MLALSPCFPVGGKRNLGVLNMALEFDLIWVQILTLLFLQSQSRHLPKPQCSHLQLELSGIVTTTFLVSVTEML